MRTVRQGGPDGPPVGLEICPETLLSLVVWRRCIADGPLRVSGQSASQSRNSPETLVVLVGLPSGIADGPPLGCGQSAGHFSLKYSSCIIELHSIISYAFV